MKEVAQTILIDRSAQEAFDFTLNPENTPKWVGNVVQEMVSETPTKLGTIYKNQGQDGSWAELEITDFEPGLMFEMTKKGDSTHVKYTFKPISNTQCELEYMVWISDGTLGERFSESNIQNILQKLKHVIEA
jgi:uncharacterized protein YndB with AHSA1/START domain